EHFYYVCAASDKEAVLARILSFENPESAIIFCNTKADVRFITAYLSKRDFNIDQISGDLPQAAREKAIAKIKAGKLRFLVATDVAARGIDISDLAYVINYTTSDSPEVYVHRTGRTRRWKSSTSRSVASRRATARPARRIPGAIGKAPRRSARSHSDIRMSTARAHSSASLSK
ncbi:MAG: C-terminal helicase domain-containing protein, partial [Acidobacteriota bacterium]